MMVREARISAPSVSQRTTREGNRALTNGEMCVGLLDCQNVAGLAISRLFGWLEVIVGYDVVVGHADALHNERGKGKTIRERHHGRTQKQDLPPTRGSRRRGDTTCTPGRRKPQTSEIAGWTWAAR
jgi:hypothetical protein